MFPLARLRVRINTFLFEQRLHVVDTIFLPPSRRDVNGLISLFCLLRDVRSVFQQRVQNRDAPSGAARARVEVYRLCPEQHRVRVRSQIDHRSHIRIVSDENRVLQRRQSASMKPFALMS